MGTVPSPSGFPGGARRPGTVYRPRVRPSSRAGVPLPEGPIIDSADPRVTPFVRETLERQFGRKVAEEAAERAAVRVAGKIVSRAIPFVGEALLAYDLYKMLRPLPPITRPDWENITDPSGWTEYHQAIGDPTGKYWWQLPWFDGIEGNGDVRIIAGTVGDGLSNEVPLIPASTPAQIQHAGQVAIEVGVTDPAGNVNSGIVRSWYKPVGNPDVPGFANPRVEEVPVWVPREVTLPSTVPWSEIPAWQPDPWSSPNERTDKGYGVEPEAPPDGLPYPPGVTYQPGAPPRPGKGPNPNRQPPRKRTKEKKVRDKNRAVGFVWQAISEVTEAMDMMKALYQALPKEFRTGYSLRHRRDGSTYWHRDYAASAWQRYQDVYRHFDKINAKDALKNLLKQKLGDRVQAKIGQNLARASREMDSPIGLGAKTSRHGVGPKAGQTPWQGAIDQTVDWLFG